MIQVDNSDHSAPKMVILTSLTSPYHNYFRVYVIGEANNCGQTSGAIAIVAEKGCQFSNYTDFLSFIRMKSRFKEGEVITSAQESLGRRN